MTDHNDTPPDTARASALPSSPPPSIPQQDKLPSIPPGALDDAPAWALEILRRYDSSQETMRLHVASVFDKGQEAMRVHVAELTRKIDAVEEKHDALARQVQREDTTRSALPVIALTLSILATIVWLVRVSMLSAGK